MWEEKRHHVRKPEVRPQPVSHIQTRRKEEMVKEMVKVMVLNITAEDSFCHNDECANTDNLCVSIMA
eukprot:12914817-Prorocentrum_lima.AAC.1